MPRETFRDPLLALLRSKAYQPMTRAELARKLGVPADRRAELREALATLTQEGLVVEGRKARYELRAKSGKRLVGTLKYHPRGHAFFFPDPTDAENLASGLDLAALSRVRVARHDAGTALDGDRVRVSIRVPKLRRTPPHRFQPEESADDPGGKVEQVVARRSNRVVGTFHRKGRFAWVDCDDKAIDGKIELTGDSSAQPGQLVVVDLGDWTDRRAVPRGRVIEVLGWPGGRGVDMLSIVHRFGLRTSFSDEVLAAARAVPEALDAAEIGRRHDWRGKLVITIDPADAKDHDDALWVARHGRGWSLAVHIADVSHYVKPGGVMDVEAVERGNSTYLADRVLPMLPVELSNGICSLKPDVDRLTKCVWMDISPEGEVRKVRFFDAVIHSRAKLSYEQAQAILDGRPAPEGSEKGLEQMVREGWNMAAVLRAKRFREGALDLEMPEIRVLLDEEGRATRVEPVEHTASHQLVEECMLAANEAVGRLLRERQKPAVFRIHEDPDPARLLDYTETAKLHGYHPGDLTNRAHIQKLLDSSKGTPEEHIIKLGLLKSLKRAAYAPDPLGHYGLAKADYCHFTSPIRRYADLIVHRALQPLLENPPKPVDRTASYAALGGVARHLSETERTAAEAESESRQLKLLEYLTHVTGLAEPPVFDGLVTDARPMGLMVEVPAMGLKGVVKREDLPDGRWRFEAHRMAWVAMDGRMVQSGMRVPLRVIGIDHDRRFVDFAVAGKPSGEPKAAMGRRGVAAVRKHEKPKPKVAAEAGPPARRKGAANGRGKRRRRRG